MQTDAMEEPALQTSKEHFHISWRVWRVLSAVDFNAKRISLYGVLLHLTVSIGFPVHALLALFTFDTPEENIANLTIAFTCTATTIKFVLYSIKLHRLWEIEAILEELDKRVAGPEQRQHFQRLHKLSRFVMTSFMCIYTVITINLVVSFFISNEHALLYPAKFPMDWRNSQTAYVLAVGYQMIAVPIEIFENFVNDSFPPLVLCLLAGHCEMLEMRVSSIGHEAPEQLEQNEQELIECIRDQQKLYNLLNHIQDMISYPMLVQFIVIAINMGAAIVALIFYVKPMQERIYYVSFLFGLALEIYPICYFGANVELAFQRLQYAVFCSNWVGQTRAYRRNIMIFAERALKPISLQAGGMVPINLMTFMGNCKAAYSFFTLISDSRQADD